MTQLHLFLWDSKLVGKNPLANAICNARATRLRDTVKWWNHIFVKVKHDNKFKIIKGQ